MQAESPVARARAPIDATSPLSWSETLRTGIDIIDRQHRSLVDMVNLTARRLDGDAALSADELRQLVRYLKAYAEVHFSTEEALMALCGLPSDYTHGHHHNHMRFLNHVDDMLDDIGDQVLLDGRQLVGFLSDWLRRHILGEDQALAQRLRAAQRAALAALVPLAHDEPMGAERLPALAEALSAGHAALHASEGDILTLITGDRLPAMVIALDATLMPGAVLHANEAAAHLYGSTRTALSGRDGRALFAGEQWLRLPVVMSEVLMQGDFTGRLRCALPGREGLLPVRITHLVLDGRMVVLLVFGAGDQDEQDDPAVQRAGQVSDSAARRPHTAEAGNGNLLSRHPLFSMLDPTVLDALERDTELLSLRRAAVLYQQHAHPGGLYLVVSGLMTLVAVNRQGEERVVELVPPSRILGEVEVFSALPARHLARALTATVLLRIPAAALRTLAASHAGFAAAALASMGRRADRLAADIQSLTLHTAVERIIDHILEHAVPEEEGNVWEAMLPAQKQVIASLLDIQPATLSRGFQQLSDHGLITLDRRYVRIPDREALIRYRDQGGEGGEPPTT